MQWIETQSNFGQLVFNHIYWTLDTRTMSPLAEQSDPFNKVLETVGTPIQQFYMVCFPEFSWHTLDSCSLFLSIWRSFQLTTLPHKGPTCLGDNCKITGPEFIICLGQNYWSRRENMNACMEFLQYEVPHFQIKRKQIFLYISAFLILQTAFLFESSWMLKAYIIYNQMFY